MERKDFLKVLALSAAGGSLISFLASCKKNDPAPAAATVDFTIDLSASSNAALSSPGGTVISNQIIIINNNGTYIGLSDICTHQGCSLTYSPSSQHLQCSCHGGVFSLNGSVVSGPPPSSLKQYAVTRNGNILHITG
jgi:cytochrome b6-f complex iron-sulfur subunit